MTNKIISKGSPQWFKEFLQNDYWHLVKDVSRNTKLLAGSSLVVKKVA